MYQAANLFSQNGRLFLTEPTPQLFRRRSAARSTCAEAATTGSVAQARPLTVYFRTDLVGTLYTGNSSYRPPVFTDERFNRLAAATGDESVKKVLAAVQKKRELLPRLGARQFREGTSAFGRRPETSGGSRRVREGGGQARDLQPAAAETDQGGGRSGRHQAVRGRAAQRHRESLPRGLAPDTGSRPVRSPALHTGPGEHPPTQPVADPHHETAKSGRLRAKPVGGTSGGRPERRQGPDQRRPCVHISSSRSLQSSCASRSRRREPREGRGERGGGVAFLLALLVGSDWNTAGPSSRGGYRPSSTAA